MFSKNGTTQKKLSKLNLSLFEEFALPNSTLRSLCGGADDTSCSNDNSCTDFIDDKEMTHFSDCTSVSDASCEAVA